MLHVRLSFLHYDKLIEMKAQGKDSLGSYSVKKKKTVCVYLQESSLSLEQCTINRAYK